MPINLSMAAFCVVLATSASAEPAPPADIATAAYARGVEAEHAGRHDQAIAELTKAIAQSPTLPRPMRAAASPTIRRASTTAPSPTTRGP